MFDPVIQVLRPISPLAWLPLGLVIFQKSEPAALVCHRRVLDVADGAEHHGRRARDSTGLLEHRKSASPLAFHDIHEDRAAGDAALMFTGFRLSLGIAWLVIVASEMLTGTPGVGGFLWQEYNSLIYSHILLAILTIGVVGFLLDRMMGVAEARLRAL